MFGPKYLAAPVLANGVRSRTVYLPATPGGWTHYYTGEKYSGGENATVSAPLDELPLFVRTEVGMEMQTTDTKDVRGVEYR
jgi:alpha-glucosidase (family GH31 glycosyl hydrolase)